MKNLIFFFLFLSYAATAQENETPNKYVLGGSVLLSNFISAGPESNTSAYNISLRPYIGFQLNHRSLLGLEANIDFSGSTTAFNSRTSFVGKIRSFTYGAGIFYRFHINPKNKFKIFLQPFTRSSIENITREDFSPSFVEQRLVEFDAGIELGATYQIAKKWNLLINIWNVSYSYSDFRDGGQAESTIRTFLNGGFSLRNISFGAEYLF